MEQGHDCKDDGTVAGAEQGLDAFEQEPEERLNNLCWCRKTKNSCKIVCDKKVENLPEIFVDDGFQGMNGTSNHSSSVHAAASEKHASGGDSGGISAGGGAAAYVCKGSGAVVALVVVK